MNQVMDLNFLAGTPYIIDSELPMYLARHYLLAQHQDHPLRRYCGEWYLYNGRAYDLLSDEAMRARVYRHLELLRRQTKDGNLREVRLKRGLVNDVLDAMIACDTLVDGSIPQWLDGRTQASDYVVMDNGILRLSTRQAQEHDAALFTTTALPYQYDPQAPQPVRWVSFLESLWNDKPERIELLQEFFGHILTGDTRYQKILLIVGPKRSGKGTIAQIFKAIIGEANCCSPTMGGLAQNFGLASIIGKRLAIFGDARVSGRADTALVVDRLLSLSGGDLQTIPRKHRDDWIGQPDTRLVILSNELPNLPDPSGALPSRMLLLETEHSFLGHEDHDLKDALLAELSGILNWALAGLARLAARGRFPVLESAQEDTERLNDLASPIMAFVRDCCEVSQGHATPCATLYKHWQEWCAEQGRTHVPAHNVFGRDLVAAYPECKRVQFRSGGGKRERNYSNIRIL